MPNNTYQFLDNAKLSDDTTRFWFIRHAIVNTKDRKTLYGTNDVAICPKQLEQQQNIYQALANRLPKTALWFCTKLSRTQDTAKAIQNSGYPLPALQIENNFLEQHLGQWQGLPHAQAEQHKTYPAHPFWPFSAQERPPEGENMEDVLVRVGQVMNNYAIQYHGQDLVIVSHGGTIRAAIAHALSIPIQSALSLSIQNLSLSIIEKNNQHWRVISVNELPYDLQK